MSHFTVAVLTYNGTENEVEKLLHPFNEDDPELWTAVDAEEGEDYRYNPNARWDWWVIGGRWDGAIKGLEPLDDGGGGFNFGDQFHTLERNAAKVPEIAPDYRPFAFVTPDGEWIERGRMGWWAVVSDEKDDAEWQRRWDAALEEFSTCIAVQVDCHI